MTDDTVYLERLTVLGVVNRLLKHARTVGVWIGSGFVVSIVVTMIVPRTYTSTAVFMPESNESRQSSLIGVAAQFGIDLGSGRASESPQFYAELLRTEELLEAAVVGPYTRRTPRRLPVSQTLVDLFGIETGNRAEDQREAVEKLRDRMSIAPGRETGLVEVSVATQWPEISEQIVERLLSLIAEFNVRRRQSRGAAERQFVQERLRHVDQELRQSEDSLEAFLMRNREFRSSPELTFEHDRLQREVAMRQQIATSLSQAYEQARIEEVRNTPVITVVDNAELPAKPDSRRLILKGMLGVMLGAMVGGSVAVFREAVEESREHDHENYKEFVRLRDRIRPRFLRRKRDGHESTLSG